MDIDALKNNLRKEVRLRKKSLTDAEKRSKSDTIAYLLATDPVFLKSEVVMMYWSMADEVCTHNLVEQWYKEKNILLPVVDGEDLLIKQFTGVQNMLIGEQYGIREPGGPVFSDIDKIDLIVVPGVAFDREMNRMGRGKAYYDKLLKTTQAYKIGICFDIQVYDQVPVDEHDVKMDRIIFA